jgi:hypothetical protein
LNERLRVEELKIEIKPARLWLARQAGGDFNEMDKHVALFSFHETDSAALKVLKKHHIKEASRGKEIH